MKFWIPLFIAFCFFEAGAQNNDRSAVAENLAYRDKMNREFADPEESPLTEEDRENFTTLEFFPVDLRYRVEARFVRTRGEKPFEMPTTTDRKPIYQKYGEAHFEIDRQKFVLSLYQSHRLRMIKEYKNHLFLPFNDWTNGNETYGGGRFLDLEIPEGDTIVIDFNKAYNPYCVYNYKYSCPIPPQENKLEVEIRAGVKAYKEH